MRYLAALLFVLAAIDAPFPGLDRAGIALLGLSALALAIAEAVSIVERVTPRPMPPTIFGDDDELEQELGRTADRVNEYLGGREARA